MKRRYHPLTILERGGCASGRKTLGTERHFVKKTHVCRLKKKKQATCLSSHLLRSTRTSPRGRPASIPAPPTQSHTLPSRTYTPCPARTCSVFARHPAQLCPSYRNAGPLIFSGKREAKGSAEWWFHSHSDSSRSGCRLDQPSCLGPIGVTSVCRPKRACKAQRGQVSVPVALTQRGVSLRHAMYSVRTIESTLGAHVGGEETPAVREASGQG